MMVTINYTRKQKTDKRKKERKEQPTTPTSQFPNVTWFKIAISLTAFAFLTLAANLVLRPIVPIWELELYQISIGLILILLVFDWITSTLNIEKAKTVVRWGITITMIVLVATILVPKINNVWSRATSTQSQTTRKSALPPLTLEEQLQNSLSYYMELWGEPKKIDLSERKWVEVCRAEVGDKIHYLSMENFWAKKEGGTRLWPLAISEENWAKFMSNDINGDDTPVWLSKNKVDTTVYVWIERKDRPPK